MSMTWFKAHTEARVDPKLRCLTRDEHYVWFQLLCYAAEQPERGTIESFDDRVLAHAVADGDADLLVATLETLSRLRIVSSVSSSDDDVSSSVSSRVITFVNFAKRQYANVSMGASSPPRKSTDRVRKCRVNKKLRGMNVTDETVKQDETLNETQRNAVKQGHETTDTDSEREEKTPYISPPVPDQTEPTKPAATPTKGDPEVHPVVDQPRRTPEDLADVRKAEQILAADMRTEKLAWSLGREHDLRDLLPIPGWKWIRAAEKILEPGIEESARRNLKYLARIAGNIDDSDRDKPARNASRAHKPDPPVRYHRSEKTIARLQAQGVAV